VENEFLIKAATVFLAYYNTDAEQTRTLCTFPDSSWFLAIDCFCFNFRHNSSKHIGLCVSPGLGHSTCLPAFGILTEELRIKAGKKIIRKWRQSRGSRR
jgi:hypothetical protein